MIPNPPGSVPYPVAAIRLGFRHRYPVSGTGYLIPVSGTAEVTSAMDADPAASLPRGTAFDGWLTIRL
jgi:hypothetical protein